MEFPWGNVYSFVSLVSAPREYREALAPGYQLVCQSLCMHNFEGHRSKF